MYGQSFHSAILRLSAHLVNFDRTFPFLLKFTLESNRGLFWFPWSEHYVSIKTRVIFWGSLHSDGPDLFQ